MLSKEGLPPSYIFGTMHVKSNTAHQFAERLVMYLEEVEIFAAEMDLASIDSKQFLLSRHLPQGQTLKEYFPAEKKYQKVRRILLKSFHVDLDNLIRLHPFIIMAIIGESVLDADHLDSLDQHLWNMADSMGLELTGLETFEKQMELLAQIPIDISLKQLTALARNPAKYRHLVKLMLEHYQDQDVRTIYHSGRRQLGALRRILLYERNVDMTMRMMSLAGKGSVFAGVGAGHLAGSKGMLRLLKKEGWKLSPVEL